MWDDFWRVVIFVALIAALTTCTSCALKGSESETIIDAAADAGCSLQTIKFDREGNIERIDCHPGLRVVR
jgi:hypothetical protein